MSALIKIAMIMNQNSYAGREYLSKLKDLEIDVILIGSYPEFNHDEEERCGNLWKPESEKELSDYFNFYSFKSLNSNELEEFLISKNYHVGIQGGTGIIKSNIIRLFSLGLLNFHPGDLPFYRGCSAPEWQLYEQNKIVSTAHKIDEGIDTGEIISKRELNVSLKTYAHFRASIYPETSKFVRDIILSIINGDDLILKSFPQNEQQSIYRKYIGDEKINELKKILSNS
jgi:methionyl-tRNA formyltransferase